MALNRSYVIVPKCGYFEICDSTFSPESTAYVVGFCRQSVNAEFICDALNGSDLLDQVKAIVLDMFENGDGANFYHAESPACMHKLKDLLDIKTQWENENARRNK